MMTRSSVAAHLVVRVGMVAAVAVLVVALGACTQGEETAKVHVQAQLVRQPLLFEPSEAGEVGSSSYLTRGSGYDLQVGPTRPVLGRPGAASGQVTPVVGLRAAGRRSSRTGARPGGAGGQAALPDRR